MSAFILIEITLLLPPKRLRRSRPIVKRPCAPSETQYLCEGAGKGSRLQILMTAIREKKKEKVKAVRGSGLGRREGPREVKVFSWSENVSAVAKGERAAEDLRGGEGGGGWS